MNVYKFRTELLDHISLYIVSIYVDIPVNFVGDAFSSEDSHKVIVAATSSRVL